MADSLSPSAQAVLYAAHNAPEGRDSYRMSAAAALRAAADQVVPFNDEMSTWARLLRDVRSEFLSIANELDQPSS